MLGVFISLAPRIPAGFKSLAVHQIWIYIHMLKECKYFDCGSRRVSWDNPYTPRGPQMVEDPHLYCSFECAILDGFYCLCCGSMKEKHKHHESCRHRKNLAVKLDDGN